MNAVTVDVEKLGFIERRPRSGRECGVPVGHHPNGQPIWRPLWADYEWFAVWTSAESIALAKRRRRMHLTHISHGLLHADHSPPTAEEACNARDSLATLRDLWAALDAEAVAS